MNADPAERRPAWEVPRGGVGAWRPTVSGDGFVLGVAPTFKGVRALVIPVARTAIAEESLVKAVAHGVHDRPLRLEKSKRMKYFRRKGLQRFGILGHDPVSACNRRDLSRFREGAR